MKRSYHRDLIQGSDEWHEIRVGRLTSSTLGAFIFTKGKDDLGLGATLIPHLDKVASEVYTQTTDDSDFENDSMARGKALEKEAIELYEMDRFVTVEDVGFVECGLYLGDSPDGLIGVDGCAEVKCRKLHLHYAMIKAIKSGEPFKMPAKDKAQCFWHMFICERKWCDYMSYHPDFPENQRLAVIRLEMTPEILEALTLKGQNIDKYISQSLQIVGSNIIAA